MSPILPQYQRLPNDGEDVIDTWKTPLASDANDTYPPRHASGSGSGFGESIVTFIFVPRWPVKGKTESVLAVMGKDKEVTTAMVQRAFPLLSSYSPGRIEFLAPEDKDAKVDSGTGWSRILDETWDRLQHSSTERLKVQIADGPGDEKARKKRERRNTTLIILATVSPMIIGFLVMAIVAYVKT